MQSIKESEPLFGCWHIESLIGAGSYGKVYKAYRDGNGERLYSAIKYISVPSNDAELSSLCGDMPDDADVAEYCRKLAENIGTEVGLFEKLKSHPNVVSCEESLVKPKPSGIGYDILIRMELLESLTTCMQRKPLDRTDVIKLGVDICTALEVYSANGIIHRNINPNNIFQNAQGDFKLGGYGIARQIKDAFPFVPRKGTYNYTAPEVFHGEKYGANCDVYSLGILLYRLMNRNRLPFYPPAPKMITPENREAALLRRMNGETPGRPLDADKALGEVILKACEPDTGKRYQTAAEFKAALLALRPGNDASEAAPRPFMDTDKYHAARFEIRSDKATAAPRHGKGGTEHYPRNRGGKAFIDYESPRRHKKTALKGVLIGLIALLLLGLLLFFLLRGLGSCSSCAGKQKADQGDKWNPAQSCVNFTVDSKTTCTGETISIDVKLSGEYEFHSLLLLLRYDPSVMTLISVSSGDILTDGPDGVTAGSDYTSDPGTVRLSVECADEGIFETGTLFTLTFAVAENAASGNYELGIDVEELTYRMYDGEEADVPHTEHGGIVCVQ